MAVSPDGSRVYLAEEGGVRVFNTADNLVAHGFVYDGSEAPDALAVSPDGSRLYVVHFSQLTVSIPIPPPTGSSRMSTRRLQPPARRRSALMAAASTS